MEGQTDMKKLIVAFCSFDKVYKCEGRPAVIHGGILICEMACLYFPVP
jgi:hypothetical protein